MVFLFWLLTMNLKMMYLDHFKMQGYLKLRKMQLKMTGNVNENVFENDVDELLLEHGEWSRKCLKL